MTEVPHPSRLLLSPAPLGPFTLRNRMVMAPMTRCRAGAGNLPTDLHALYYRQRASAGLIVTEATQVCPEGIGYPNTPGIHSDDQMAAWRGVTDAVHSEGGRIFLQLWHVGRISHPDFQVDGALPVAPSAIAPAGTVRTSMGPQPYVTPRALDREEIPGVVAQFADGARRAIEAGFDGVEIHGANGYLIDQFLRDGSNQRSDEYGGALENRVRFLSQVTAAVVAAVGAEKVGVRLSPLSGYNDMSDSNPFETFAAAARELDRFGLAYLHLIAPESQNVGSESERMARLLRENFHGPLMLNGGYTHDAAETVIAAGLADFVSFGVPFLANPDLPARFAESAPLNAPNPATFYGGGAEGYVDYPKLLS